VGLLALVICWHNYKIQQRRVQSLYGLCGI